MEPVVTSTEVLADRWPVTRIVRTSETWLYLSGYEADDSEPVVLHVAHVLDEQPDLWAAPRLRPLQYALRATPSDDWTVRGPVADGGALDRLLEDGTVDAQQEELQARASRRRRGDG